MGAMVASVRNKARSITETIRLNVSRRAWILFNLFIWFTLVMIIVAFTDVTTSAFVNTVDYSPALALIPEALRPCTRCGLPAKHAVLGEGPKPSQG